MATHEIGFIGSSALGLRTLLASSRFRVVAALCMASRCTEELEAAARDAGIPLDVFTDRAGFRALMGARPQELPYLIYQLDMLVPADLTETHRLFNIHRGSLYTNRGPNPDVWPILNGESSTALSLHRIDDKVDAGQLIDAIEVAIGAKEDTVSVQQRLERELPGLVASLAEHLEGRRPGVKVEGGTYRPWISEADFTIDLASDTPDIIDRKIRSQRRYNGAVLFVENVKHYVTSIEAAVPLPSADRHPPEVCSSVIVVCSLTHRLSLRRNRSPAFPPPPRRPPSTRI